MNPNAQTVEIPATLTHLGCFYELAAANALEEYTAIWPRTRDAAGHYVEVEQLPVKASDEISAMEEARSKLFRELRPALKNHLLTAAIRLTAEDAQTNKDVFATQIPLLIDRGVVPVGPAHVLMESAKVFLANQIPQVTYLRDDINELIEFAILYKNSSKEKQDSRRREWLGAAYGALERLSFEAREEELLSGGVRGDFDHASMEDFPGLRESVHMRFSRIMQNCRDWKRLEKGFGITPALLDDAFHYKFLARDTYEELINLIPKSRWSRWSRWFRP